MEHKEPDLHALIARYEEELMQLRQQAIPAAATTAARQSMENASMDTLNFQGNISQEENADNYHPSTPETRDNEKESDIFATLQVRVTAAGEALPIPNALVTIGRETTAGIVPEAVRLTGISGLTERIRLPATDPALTLKPAEDISLITYEIQVSAPGYYRFHNSGVPLYGGIPTVQPVSLIPLPEFETPSTEELSFTVPRNPL